jgi:hypothetical protein
MVVAVDADRLEDMLVADGGELLSRAGGFKADSKCDQLSFEECDSRMRRFAELAAFAVR